MSIRSSTADVLVGLVPPRRPSLDQAPEIVREDEAREITPPAVRLRKAGLDATAGQKGARAGRRAPVGT